MKTNDTGKKVKKVSFTECESTEIENAMNAEGYRNLSEWVIHCAQNRKSMSDAEKRRNQKFKYKCAVLHTIHNELRAGVNVEENMQRFMIEVTRICQELM